MELLKTYQPNDYQEAVRVLVLPLLAFVVFLGLWSFSAARIETSLGQVPGPMEVWGQAANLVDEHRAERRKNETRTSWQRTRMPSSRSGPIPASRPTLTRS
jgi:nitrate/nitrite transport system permease protein